jgi:hypothetical protein
VLVRSPLRRVEASPLGPYPPERPRNGDRLDTRRRFPVVASLGVDAEPQGGTRGCEAVVFSCHEHCAVPDGYAFEASRWFSEDDWVEHIRAKQDGPDRDWKMDGGYALALLDHRFAEIKVELALADRTAHAGVIGGGEFAFGSWGTLHGFLKEQADYLRVDVRPGVELDGWDVCLRLDGTYAIEEWATANADSIREQLATIPLAEIPRIEENMVRWHGLPDEDGTWRVPTVSQDGGAA